MLTLTGDDFLLPIIRSTGEYKAPDAEFQRRHFLALGRRVLKTLTWGLWVGSGA